MSLPTNALALEKSPYLLQHAQNPVNWLPWGEAAFAKARAEDKPIFLSVGYSTCHWCHVMERESFESDAIAALLNLHFIPVKVDREERPDVDRIYMMFVQATTGGGGWPMSVWLTPDLKPFYGGTYFPPEDRYGRPGFPRILDRLADAWANDRARIEESSGNVTRQLAQYCVISRGAGGLEPKQIADDLFETLRRSFDGERGGFGQAPKFPRPAALDFLLLYGSREAIGMVAQTLRAMAAGGVNDQLGGGFHRYSVDADWFVPHFEKMLYDQAQLARTAIDVWRLTGDDDLAAIARGICDYVLRDMTHPGGGFYSAEDADSVIDAAQPQEKGEGAFYVWRWEEVFDALGDEVAPWFAYRYGCLPGGNVTEDPHREFTGRNILAAVRSVDEVARHFHQPVERVAQALAEAVPKMLAARDARVRPHLDDKVLTAWNGLMISALAHAGAALEEPRYLEAARRAAEFILGQMMPAPGRLLRRYRDGEPAIDGFLDDYAAFGLALTDLYQATYEAEWLHVARQVADAILVRFEDPEDGAFFSTEAQDARLILRIKDDYDGAEPAGNTLAIELMLRMHGHTQDPRYRLAVDRALEAFTERLTKAAMAMPRLAAAAVMAHQAPRQIILAGGGQGVLRREIARRYLPGTIVMDREALPFPLEAVAHMNAPGAWVCQNFACQLPVSQPAELAELLDYNRKKE